MIFPSRQTLPSDVSHHYNELDILYRKIWGDHLHHGLWDESLKNRKLYSQKDAVKNLIYKVTGLAGIQAGDLVCDIGCGYGATARLLAKEFQAQVIGATLSERQFEYSTSLGLYPGVEVRLLNWLENDLPDNHFDHVIAVESSEHMPDKVKFFSEAYRVLKPGGSMVVCAWLSTEIPKKWETRYLLEPICSEGRLPSMGSPIEYHQFFENSGFRDISYEDITDSVKKTWTLCITGTLKHFFKYPKDTRYLFKSLNSNADFLKTLFRLRLAYETRSMRYGVFKASKS